eukprot:1497012-Rhodomonas_salina.1
MLIRVVGYDDTGYRLCSYGVFRRAQARLMRGVFEPGGGQGQRTWCAGVQRTSTPGAAGSTHECTLSVQPCTPRSLSVQKSAHAFFLSTKQLSRRKTVRTRFLVPQSRAQHTLSVQNELAGGGVRVSERVRLHTPSRVSTASLRGTANAPVQWLQLLRLRSAPWKLQLSLRLRLCPGLSSRGSASCGRVAAPTTLSTLRYNHIYPPTDHLGHLRQAHTVCPSHTLEPSDLDFLLQKAFRAQELPLVAMPVHPCARSTIP